MDMLTWERASIGSFTALWNPSQAVNLQCEEDKSLLRSEKELFLFSGVQVNISWQDDVLLMEERGKFPS